MNSFEKDKNGNENVFAELESCMGYPVKALDREDMVRLIRLTLEGLEVALHLCNTFLNSFGPSRLLDVLEQILPTAYVINTAYWPLYRTETGQSICICNLFEISCPHISDGLSWIDLDQPITEVITFKDGAGAITLMDLNMSISKYAVKKFCLDSTGGAFCKYQKSYEIHLEFKPKNCLQDVADEFGHSVKCLLRFQIVKPKMEFNKFCLWLTPHPIFNPLYGLYFPCLTDNLVMASYPTSLIVTWNKCPKYTMRVLEKSVSKIYETISLNDVGLGKMVKKKESRKINRRWYTK